LLFDIAVSLGFIFFIGFPLIRLIVLVPLPDKCLLSNNVFTAVRRFWALSGPTFGDHSQGVKTHLDSLADCHL
jgi:hypothetical protein